MTNPSNDDDDFFGRVVTPPPQQPPVSRPPGQEEDFFGRAEPEKTVPTQTTPSTYEPGGGTMPRVEAPPGKPFDRDPKTDEGRFGGTDKLAGTVAGTVRSNVTGGIVGDTTELALRLAAAGQSIWDPRTKEQIKEGYDKWFADQAAQRRADLIHQLHGAPADKQAEIIAHLQRIDANPSGKPPTTQERYDTDIKPKYGEYNPTDLSGKAIKTYAPAAMFGAPGVVGTGLAQTAEALGAGQTTQDLASLAGSKGAKVAGKFTGAVRKSVGILSPEEQQNVVGEAVGKNINRNPDVTKAINQVSPGIPPEYVAELYQKHLDTLNQNKEATALPGAPDLATSEAASAQRFQQLKDLIPRYVTAQTSALVSYARDKLAYHEAHPNDDLAPAAKERLEHIVSNFGDTSSFGDLVDFDRGLSRRLGQAAKTDPLAHAQLADLKTQVTNTIKEPVANQAKWEQGPNSHLTQEETLAYNLQRQIDQWRANRGDASQQSAAAGATDSTPGGSAGVPPVAGDRAPAQGSTGNAPGSMGSDGQPRPATAEDAQRVTDFKQAYGAHQDTFAKAFAPGSEGYDHTKGILQVGGDSSLSNLKDVALNQFHDMIKPGEELTPEKINKYLTKYDGSLRAIDEAEQAAGRPKFTDQFKNHGGAIDAVRQFEKNAATKFVGVDPADLVNNIGTMIRGKDSVTKIAQLVDHAKSLENGPAIVEGLRRAAAEHFENNRGELLNHLSNPKGLDTLHALFDPTTMKSLQEVFEPFKNDPVMTRLKDRPGSAGDTALFNDQLRALVNKKIREGTATVGWTLGVTGGLATVAAHHLGIVNPLEAMESGSGILALKFGVEPLLHKMFAGRGAKSRADVESLAIKALNDPTLAKTLKENAFNPDGSLSERTFDELAKATAGAEANQETKQRSARATGGSVFDHKAAARHMISMVDKSRKQQTTYTKPLLKAHDTLVASALALANRSV